MERVLITSGLLLIIIICVGCGPSANPPKVYTPRATSNSDEKPQLQYQIAPNLVDFIETYDRAKPVGNTGIFLLQHKGGSLLLGLLGAATGGLGTALASSINGKMVSSKSAAIAKKLNNGDAFTIAQATEESFAAKNLVEANGVPIQPNLVINIHEDDKVRTTLIITSGSGESIERFFYGFKYVANKSVLEGTQQSVFFDAIFDELPTALSVFADHLPNIHTQKYGLGRKTTIESLYFAPFDGIPFHAQVLHKFDNRTVFRVNAKNAFSTVYTAHGTHLMLNRDFAEK